MGAELRVGLDGRGGRRHTSWFVGEFLIVDF
jgi:hypothetical protein